MMHQPFEPDLTLDDRPERNMIIEKDEITSLIIDLETLSPEEIYSIYFTEKNK